MRLVWIAHPADRPNFLRSLDGVRDASTSASIRLTVLDEEAALGPAGHPYNRVRAAPAIDGVGPRPAVERVVAPASRNLVQPAPQVVGHKRADHRVVAPGRVQREQARDACQAAQVEAVRRPCSDHGLAVARPVLDPVHERVEASKRQRRRPLHVQRIAPGLPVLAGLEEIAQRVAAADHKGVVPQPALNRVVAQRGEDLRPMCRTRSLR